MRSGRGPWSKRQRCHIDLVAVRQPDPPAPTSSQSATGAEQAIQLSSGSLAGARSNHFTSHIFSPLLFRSFARLASSFSSPPPPSFPESASHSLARCSVSSLSLAFHAPSFSLPCLFRARDITLSPPLYPHFRARYCYAPLLSSLIFAPNIL